MSKFCAAPFNSLVINPNGSAAPCCKYNLHNSDKDIQKENIRTKNIQELFDQPAIETLRQQFLNGEQPKGCSVCWDEEAVGIKSLRMMKTCWPRYSNLLNAGSNGKECIDQQITQLDFKFSTLCNLKCRICGPYCSSHWLKESEETNEFDEYAISEFPKYAERKVSQENYDIFDNLLDGLTDIEFTGGEPFMQPEHDKILDIINSSSKNISKLNIKYNTNGTIYNEKYINVWNKLNRVTINFSIDDIGERFEYQRYPAKWDIVVENLRKYKEATDSKKINIIVYITVSLYNIFYLDELISFSKENFRLPIVLNLVHFPKKMSIRHLSSEMKKIVIEKINKINWKDIKVLDNGIKTISDFMMESEGNGLQDFIDVTKLHDKYRNQSFEKTFPEYWNMINDN